MTHHPRPSPALPCIAAALAMTAATFAQTTENAAGGLVPIDDEEIVTLEEFRVTSNSMRDEYIASEAISGTRTGERIADIPFSVQVLTNEFLEDFQFFDDNNLLPTVPNYSPDGGGRLRGFQPLTMRDGFSRAGPAGLANTRQIEVIMGPQSTLYGQASPGGILNYISKRPTRANRQRLTISGGSYDYLRLEFDATGPLVPGKLYYMLDASQRFSRSQIDFGESDNKNYTLGLLWLASRNTSVSINWEQQFIDSYTVGSTPSVVVGSLDMNTNNPVSRSPYIRKNGVDMGPLLLVWRDLPAPTGVVNGVPVVARDDYSSLVGFNRIGPYQDNTSRFDSLTLLVEHRFNPVWSARTNFLYYHRDMDDHRWTSGAQFDWDYQRMWARSPMMQNQTIDNHAVQSELLARFTTKNIAHKFLVAIDYARDRYDNLTKYLPNYASGNPPDLFDITDLPMDTRTLDPFNPLWYQADYSKLTRVTSDLVRVYDHFGAAASLRSFFWGERLITNLSGRYRYTRGTIDSDYPGSATNTYHGAGSEDGFIYSVGANYKIFGDNLIFYANTSTSFEPSTTFDKGLVRPRESERGRGVEAGFKGTSLGSRLDYTLSVFYINKSNVAVQNPAYDAGLYEGLGLVPQYLVDGKIRVRGVELASSLRPFRGMTVLASAGYLDPEIREDDPQNNPTTVGKRPLSVPRVTASVTARYGFTRGWPKGFSIGVNGNYRGDRIATHQDDRVYSGGTASAREYVTPSLFLLNGFVSYNWKTGKRLSHSVTFNVRNALDKFYLSTSYTYGAPRNFIITYRLNF
ncbi:MAG: TonB-dependent receptor plug domain-containing protein [Opitutaceae bacterium]|jgi:outer membrane receptor protein involved in Fe transport|nr:TonB-dependent receptor plug domain-containing protein [Opitutaceae bacterium]